MATKTIKEDSLTLSVGQTACMLGISYYLAQKLIKAGKIPSIRFGKIIRVSKTRLFNIINSGDICNIGSSGVQ